MNAPDVDTSAVLTRTEAGSQAAIGKRELASSDLRLLLLVNGFTPLHAFAQLTHGAAIDIVATAAALLEAGLVQRVVAADTELAW